MATPKNIIGPQVRRLRNAAGLSQPALAAACQRRGWDIERDTIAKIEGGTRWVCDSELVELARALGAPMVELFPARVQGLGENVATGSTATGGLGGAGSWDFAQTSLPDGATGPALKTGPTPHSGQSYLEATFVEAGVLSWTWKVSTQENFDWLLCEVDGQEAAGISTKNGIWQTQVVQVPAGANVRWVYRKDASGNIGEDAGYLADVEFRSLAANQSFSQWAQTHGIYDPQQRMPKSGMQAMFGWLGGFRVDGDARPEIVVAQGRLTYRYPVSKTADGTQQILYSPDMSAWTTRRISQQVVSEDADRMVIEATAPSGTKGFFKGVGGGDTTPLGLVNVQGGSLPQTSGLAGTAVATFQIGKTEVTWDEWQEVRAWAMTNGYSDLAGVGAGSAGGHPVRDVSWYDVVKWCNAKSEKEGRTPVYRVGTIVYRLGQSAPTLISGANGYRLPNEAEWEWASRGGVNSQGYYFSGSDEVNSVAWHYGNSIGSVADVAGGGEEERGPWPVAQKLPNELGIHDMSGNLLEWCEDIEFGTYRRLRGGGWVYSAGDCGVGVRYFNDDAGYSYDYFGFRVARNAD